MDRVVALIAENLVGTRVDVDRVIAEAAEHSTGELIRIDRVAAVERVGAGSSATVDGEHPRYVGYGVSAEIAEESTGSMEIADEVAVLATMDGVGPISTIAKNR